MAKEAAECLAAGSKIIKSQKYYPKEIIQFCQKNMAKYKVPTSVEFRKELPKSHVGKVLRKILREEEEAKKSPNRPT